MAGAVRKSGVREIPLSEIKDDLSRFLHEAEKREIVITRHGKPAGVLIGFESEDDWLEYRLENDPRLPRVSVGRCGSSRSNCLSFSQKQSRSIKRLPSEILNHETTNLGILFIGPEPREIDAVVSTPGNIGCRNRYTETFQPFSSM